MNPKERKRRAVEEEKRRKDHAREVEMAQFENQRRNQEAEDNNM